MAIDWRPLAELLRTHERFVLTSHVRPDADALGSELALAEMLKELGKSVEVVNPSAAPPGLDFLDPDRQAKVLGTDCRSDLIKQADVHVILDTSAWKQLNDVGKVIAQCSQPRVVIDHHVSGDQLDATEFKDTASAATGLLVYDFAKFLKLPISSTMAERLFAAIATDTGWFRFPATTSETYRVAAELIDFGAQPHLSYRSLYERRSLARMLLAGRILSRIQVECGGLLAWTSVTLEDFRATGASGPDTEELVNECLTVDGVVAAFIAVQQPSGMIKFSLRSQNDLNVAAIAEKFAGGGHRQASGAMLPGPQATAIERVRHEFQQLLTGESEGVPT